ncbi:uncharacterized protein K444DRAFT_539685, partial [Hyaloscypha bicolor E]
KNHYGLSPLHGAAEQGHHGIATMLLEKGARVDAKPPRGEDDEGGEGRRGPSLGTGGQGW